MSTTTVTLEELESERADLLPSRETMCRPPCCHPCGGFEVAICISVNVCVL